VSVRRRATEHWPLLSKLRRALRTEPNVRLTVLYGSVARLLLRAIDEGRVVLDRDSEWTGLTARRDEIAQRARHAHEARRQRARASIRQLSRNRSAEILLVQREESPRRASCREVGALEERAQNVGLDLNVLTKTVDEPSGRLFKLQDF
jgi:hypothetical protein